MPKFEITFEREVHAVDRVTRIVEADSLEDAQAKGDTMASEFDMKCPDDAEEISANSCQDWGAIGVRNAPADATVDD